MKDFPDYVHFERLAQALWARPGTGQATVMVGAGMSLNTVKTSSSARSMLTWSQLTSRIIDAVYPRSGEDLSAREKMLSACNATSGFQRAAEEAEALLGRPTLDSIIANAVPDLDHEPSYLHNLLLQLPWADVLTTNYDTLLERGARRIHDRRYSLVNTPDDLGSAMRPRIVKLHGSLPSIRPFVLTEEDFRIYPRRNPAFVNLARQAILETALCLVGFSGDDPNFLQWSGWVRDVLGTSTRQIYLCGVLDLSVAQRHLLQSRHVVPIDLSPLFPEDQFPVVADRHAHALEWLLLALGNREPTSLLDWPNSSSVERPNPSPRLPKIPDSIPNGLARETYQP